ncbi:hypothetical protein P3T43_003355 [Paraburkholderia sp. GAS41]
MVFKAVGHGRCSSIVSGKSLALLLYGVELSASVEYKGLQQTLQTGGRVGPFVVPVE